MGKRERSALNEAAYALELQDWKTTNHATSLKKLFALDRAQAEEIVQLRAMVTVLTELLVQEKVVAGGVLEIRLKDKLREIDEASRPKAKPSASGGPYRGEGIPAQPEVPEPVTKCSQCGDEVFTRSTQITAKGVICDGCYYAKGE